MGLVEQLRSRGVEVYVFAPRQGPLTVELAKRKVIFKVAPYKLWIFDRVQDSLLIPLKIIFNIPSACILLFWAVKWRADIIYSSNISTPMGFVLSIILRKPHVWHIRQFAGPDSGIHFDFGRRILKAALRKADALIFVSEPVRKAVFNEGKDKVHIIPNGVEIPQCLDSAMPVAKVYEKYAGEYVFGMFTRLYPLKGQEEALRAVKCLKEKHPHIRLIIAGKDYRGYQKFLRKLSVELGVEKNITFTGFLWEPLPWYCMVDVVLVCSLREALSRVVLEAMSVGKPVIGKNTSTVNEMITHETDGLLYNNGYVGLAQCMARCIENPAWAKELGLRGRQKVVREYTVEQYGADVYAILKTLSPAA